MVATDINIFFFFNDTATTEIYTLSLHDALPICLAARDHRYRNGRFAIVAPPTRRDRKSTRLNSSHRCISYAVFCLKKPQKIADPCSDVRPQSQANSSPLEPRFQ